ncbi:protein DOG1-like 4 [Diospyros lotus]|uniref:protein DOG1-like 4 n=1 Tax=Diospyros lotus TaxID=55363 RepID=UPI002256A1A9|nr:protein DOG1-like 4 [Diospyros lotus]
MSLLLDQHLYMAEQETFHKFFNCWITEQDCLLQELTSAAASNDDDTVLRPLVVRVLQHYEHYYGAKSRWARDDIFSMFSPSWTTTLENAFLWIGGWRPSMAFHLLFSKSGLQLEQALEVLIRGLCSGDLADLSPAQVSQADNLQRHTIREEKEITEEMAKHQETIADPSMVELSHEVSELLRNGGGFGGEAETERLESNIAAKEKRLKEILQRADDLRLRTLKGVVDILTPVQAVHFLIAAAELHLRLHDWGRRRDAVHAAANNQPDDGLRGP